MSETDHENETTFDTLRNSTIRGEYWKNDISVQFPVHNIIENENDVLATVGAPHEGYTIQTKLVNNKLNGDSTILNPYQVRIATLTYVDGAASGKCSLYDECGILFFSGSLVNGFRSGKGEEYDENGYISFRGSFVNGVREGNGKEFYSNRRVKFIGSYKKGLRSGKGSEYYDNGNLMFRGQFVNGLRQWKGRMYSPTGTFLGERMFDKGVRQENYIPFSFIPHCWEEMNIEKNETMVCQLDQFGKRIGTGYLFIGDQISRISEWNHGTESSVKKDFYENKMIEYKNGIIVYEGEFHNSPPTYAREGDGIEYYSDGISARYRGRFWKGKYHGLGFWYYKNKPIYKKSWIRGHQTWLVVLSMEGIKLIVILGIFGAFFILGYSLKIPLILLIIYIWRLFSVNRCGFDVLVGTHCLLKRTLLVGKNSCKLRSTFNPPPLLLRSIEIGDNCFSSVTKFQIEGLYNLESLRIGKNTCTKESGYKDHLSLFHILNCDKLKIIRIDNNSFRHYHKFELRNLPALVSISLGSKALHGEHGIYTSLTMESDIE